MGVASLLYGLFPYPKVIMAMSLAYGALMAVLLMGKVNMADGWEWILVPIISFFNIAYIVIVEARPVSCSSEEQKRRCVSPMLAIYYTPFLMATNVFSFAFIYYGLDTKMMYGPNVSDPTDPIWSIYFVVVLMTTCGFGDVLVAHPDTAAIAVIHLITTGVFFLGFLSRAMDLFHQWDQDVADRAFSASASAPAPAPAPYAYQPVATAPSSQPTPNAQGGSCTFVPMEKIPGDWKKQ